MSYSEPDTDPRGVDFFKRQDSLKMQKNILTQKLAQILFSNFAAISQNSSIFKVLSFNKISSLSLMASPQSKVKDESRHEHHFNT